MTLLTNGLILQLAQDDQNQVHQICTLVRLTAGQSLCNPEKTDGRKVYFLIGASVALLVTNPLRNSLAVGLVGSEGAIGLGAVLNKGPENIRFQVQTSGEAWMANQADLALLLHQRPGMLWVISQHLWQLAAHVAQMAATAQFCDINTRLAHWLVLSSEKAQTMHLKLTHDHLAHMLGVRRVSITLAAGELREMGLISYQRGSLEILNLPELRQMAHPQP